MSSDLRSNRHMKTCMGTHSGERPGGRNGTYSGGRNGTHSGGRPGRRSGTRPAAHSLTGSGGERRSGTGGRGRRHGRFRPAGFLGALSLAAALLLLAAVAAHAVEILDETDEEIVLRVRLKDFHLDDVQADGVRYKIISGSDFVKIAEAGEPDVPAYSYTLAVPAGGRAAITSVEASFDVVASDVRIAPLESIDPALTNEMGLAAFKYVEDPGVYEAPGRFPAETAWLEAPGRFRHQDIVRAVVAPLSYEPATGRLYAARDVIVRVRFEGPAGRRGVMAHEGRWERLYERVFVNYDRGRRWRVSAEPMPDLLRQAPENDRFKILISETGMYSIDYAALSGVGFPEGVAVDDIFIYRDGFVEGDPDTLVLEEAAILLEDGGAGGVFDEGDEIVFYARDFYDEFGARWSQDRFFDKNVYWLSWGEGEHARMSSEDGWPDLENPSYPAFFAHRMHLESDSGFCSYPPHEVADYYWWTVSYEISPTTIPFEVYGIDETQPAEVRANFIGYTNSGQGVTDDVEIAVISCDSVETAAGTGRYSFPGMRNFTYQLDPGALCEGTNWFSFKTSLAATYNPGSCLDWFEITYARKYEALGDLLEFTSGDSLGEIQIEVGGFSGWEIRLFDVSDPNEPVRLTLPGESIVENGGVYSLTFRDSISDTTSYVALTGNAIRTLDSGDIQRTPAPLLRTEPGTYLIICHPDFVDAVEPLIGQREAEGHTVIFATTEEVYDDFGNGMKSDEAVKRFIEHAFFTRGAEFALLVGDANVDRRGLLLDREVYFSDVDYVPSHSFRIRENRAGLNWELRANEGWFGCVDGPADRYPDVYIGRLPVDTYEEAQGAVQKILAYENYEGSDPWKKRVLLVADDQYGDDLLYKTATLWWTPQTQFVEACDSVGVIATDTSVVAADTVKYYLNDCTKYDQPESRCGTYGCGPNTYQTQAYTQATCTPQLRALLNSGAFMVNFQGHANEWQFCHEFLLKEDQTAHDVLTLSNAGRPFVLFAFGCWISNFDRLYEARASLQEAIGEKFVKNPNGAGSACLASACAEPISGNQRFNSFVARAIFDYLTPFDRQGNPLEARVLAGEVALTALLRYGNQSYIDRHILFGDPAMIMDMGPPHLATTVDDSLIDDTYVYAGDQPDTLDVVSVIKDEEAISKVDIGLILADRTVDVPPGDYEETALTDSGFVRSRAYEVAYGHVPRLGEYSVRITATDYAGRTAFSEFGVSTGSVEFYKEGTVLAEGGTVVIDQTLRVVMSRPVAFTEDDISVKIDTIPAEGFDEYQVRMTDVEGKQWEVSFVPTLTSGAHTIIADVQGFVADRGFVYAPGDVDYFVDGRPLYENDFVSPEPVLEALVKGTVDTAVVGVTLDGEEPDSLWYVPDSTETTLTIGLSPILDVGGHSLTVTVEEVGLTRNFRVSNELTLTDVSAFPNPFSDFIYIYYTLTSEASEVRLEVFTVSGRRIFQDGMLTPYAGYNIYRWNGRDSAGDEIANGTYIYKLRVRSPRGEQEFSAPIARLK
jgi:hypothetical protein